MAERGTDVPTGGAVAVRIALVLTLLVLVLASVRFARFDWSGLPLDRQPVTVVREVSGDCVERIEPYETSSGRTISPVTVDEEQYLSMVAYYRGARLDELAVTCQLDPFVRRAATPWLAHLLPGDEGVALGTVNLLSVLIATWATVFALRAQQHRARVIAVVGTLFAVGWNTFFFGSAVLTDAGGVALVAVCWLLLCLRRPWWLWPVLLVSYPVRETAAVVVLGILAAWTLAELRASSARPAGGHRSTAAVLAPFAAAVAAALASVVIARAWFLEGEATWNLGPSVGAFTNNLFGPVGIASFLIATVPLFLPALLAARDRIRADGWTATLGEPAVVGVVLTAGLCAWVSLAADLSPRFAWIGFPVAASLAATFFDHGRGSELVERLPVPRWLT